jgi:flagellar motor switch protein FliN/FliY
MLSQAEIDALLRSLQEESQASAAPAPEPGPQPGAATRVSAQPSPQPGPRALYDLPPGFGLLLGVRVTLSVELGSTIIDLGDLLQLGRSSLVVLDGRVDAPLTLFVNGVPFAEGIVVETNGRYGLRVTELLQPQEGARAS